MAATAKNSNGKSDPVSVEDLSLQVEILKNDIATLTQSLGNYTKGMGAAAAENAQAKASEAASLGAEKITEAQMKTEEFVRAQPATSLGLAAGLGFLIGMMTARR